MVKPYIIRTRKRPNDSGNAAEMENMKMKIEITYTNNEQLWKMEDIAEAHGYRKTNDCYWAQIFENAAGDQIVTSREDRAETDPAAALEAALATETETETAEQQRDDLAQKLAAMTEDRNGQRARLAQYADELERTIEERDRLADELHRLKAALQALSGATV